MGCQAERMYGSPPNGHGSPAAGYRAQSNALESYGRPASPPLNPLDAQLSAMHHAVASVIASRDAMQSRMEEKQQTVEQQRALIYALETKLQHAASFPPSTSFGTVGQQQIMPSGPSKSSASEHDRLQPVLRNMRGVARLVQAAARGAGSDEKDAVIQLAQEAQQASEDPQLQELLQELHTLASTVVHVFDWFETRAREAAASLQKQLRDARNALAVAGNNTSAPVAAAPLPVLVAAPAAPSPA